MSLTAAEQYLLELTNRARLDPAAEAARNGIDLNAGLAAGTISTQSKQVLASNDDLQGAASAHSLWMLEEDVFSHTGEGGSSAGDRATEAGYNWNALGENIGFTGTTGTLNIEAAVEQIHNSLFVSSGHRVNMLNASYTETGMAVEIGTFTQGGINYTSAMVTEMFGRSGTSVFLTGVAYTDSDGDKFYSMGEGRASVTFTAQGKSDVTEAAGGYGIGLSATTALAVTGQAGSLAFSATVDLSLGNVKLDLVDNSWFYTSGSITLGTGVQNVLLLGVMGLSANGNAAANQIIGNKGANTLHGYGGNDGLITGGGNDRVYGDAGNDTLTGEGGNDLLRGGAGTDRLQGGDGTDKLYGDAGNDTLTGGNGPDSFFFAPNFGRDQISDFSVSGGDLLKIDDAIWGGAAMTAAQVVAEFASVSGGSVVFDFGGGMVLTLSGVTSTQGLAAGIDLI
jgi:uncharacterized protein YkwD